MASKTTTNMAAIVGLGRVASQVTLLEPEPALYSAAWSRDQSSDQTVTCADTMAGVSRMGKHGQSVRNSWLFIAYFWSEET